MPPSSKDASLCQMFSTWGCRMPRLKQGLCCAKHTCDAAGCMKVVASPNQRYCEKHQLNKLLLQSPNKQPANQGAVASLKPLTKPSAAPSPPTRRRANAVVIVPNRAPIKGDDEYKSMLKAIQAVVQEPGFQKLWQKETSNRSRFSGMLKSLANQVMLSDLQWQAVVNFLTGQMNLYASQKRHFAYDFSQDLLCYAERKVDEAQIEFVVFGTTMLVFPLLAPYLAAATAAVGLAKGAIAAKATSEALQLGQKAAKAGANALAKRLELGEEQTRLAGRPKELLSSQGKVDTVIEKLSTLKGNPLLFARLLSRYLAAAHSGPEAKLIITHFGKRNILSWDRLLDPGEHDDV